MRHRFLCTDSGLFPLRKEYEGISHATTPAEVVIASVRLVPTTKPQLAVSKSESLSSSTKSIGSG